MRVQKTFLEDMTSVRPCLLQSSRGMLEVTESCQQTIATLQGPHSLVGKYLGERAQMRSGQTRCLEHSRESLEPARKSNTHWVTKHA